MDHVRCRGSRHCTQIPTTTLTAWIAETLELKGRVGSRSTHIPPFPIGSFQTRCDRRVETNRRGLARSRAGIRRPSRCGVRQVATVLSLACRPSSAAHPRSACASASDAQAAFLRVAGAQIQVHVARRAHRCTRRDKKEAALGSWVHHRITAPAPATVLRTYIVCRELTCHAPCPPGCG